MRIINDIYQKILPYFPPKFFTKLKYFKVFRKKLNLNNPITLNEKIQWKKIYDHNSFYTLCADKYAVRDLIKKKIGEKYLIPLLYYTDKPEDIPFDKLHLPYIIKSNHCSGHTIIIRDKKEINKKEIIKKCKHWLKINYYKQGKEWQYKNIKPKILIEKLLLDEKKNIPKDYKFHCFNGEVEFIAVDTDRFGKHKRSFFDKTWRLLPFTWSVKIKGKPENEIEKNILKPRKLKEMIKLVESLSDGFDYIRVDLYIVKDKIYFGELTFHHGGGFQTFFPGKYDLIYGKKLNLKTFKKR